MRLLSFDTSGELHLCLMENSQVVQAKVTARDESRQTIASSLLPAIDQALKQASWTKSMIDVLVVGIGPGSFTGIRSGIVTARTIGQALSLPVIGVSKLDCLGRRLKEQLPAGIVLNAGTNRGVMHYFAAGYITQGTDVKAQIEPAYLAAEKLSRVLGDFPFWFAENDCQAVIESVGGNFKSLPQIENIAIIQAEIAHDRLSLKVSAGQSPGLSGEQRQELAQDWPYAKVTPLYLRSPSITLKASK